MQIPREQSDCTNFLKKSERIYKQMDRHNGYKDRQQGELISLLLFLAYNLYFEQIKVGLWDLRAVCESVNPNPHPINF
jgi:hypothetical protein